MSSSLVYKLRLLLPTPVTALHASSYIIEKAEEEYFSKVGNRHMPNNKREEFDPYSIMPGSINLSPKRRLLAILRKDEDIKEWFSKWISDLMNYQKEMLNKIFSFSKEIEALKNS